MLTLCSCVMPEPYMFQVLQGTHLSSCMTRSTKKKSAGNLSTDISFMGLSGAKGSTLRTQ